MHGKHLLWVPFVLLILVILRAFTVLCEKSTMTWVSKIRGSALIAEWEDCNTDWPVITSDALICEVTSTCKKYGRTPFHDGWRCSTHCLLIRNKGGSRLNSQEVATGALQQQIAWPMLDVAMASVYIPDPLEYSKPVEEE
jgi:hypothetical protein